MGGSRTRATMITLAVAAGLAVGPAVSPAAAAVAAPSWCQGGKDSRNTGFQPAETVLTERTVGSLTPRYARPEATGLPVVVGSVGWVPAGRTLVSFDTADGRVRWRVQTVGTPATGNWISGSPAYSDGRVFVNVGGGASGSPLQAYDAATGRLLWRTTDIPLGNPTASNGRVYQSVHGAGGLDIVAAYDGASGRQLWSRTVAHEASTEDLSVAGGVVVSRQQTRLTALDAVTGALRWRVDVPFGVNAPVVSRGLVFAVAGLNDEVAAYDLSTGVRRWFTSGVSASDGTPAAADGVLYVPNGDQLTALDIRTGQVRWATAASTPAYLEAQPAVGGGVVYLGGGRIFDADTGAALGRDLGEGGTVVVAGTAYKGDGRGVTAYRPGG